MTDNNLGNMAPKQPDGNMPVNQQPPKGAGATPNSGSSRRTGLIIGIVIVAVAIVAIVIFAIFSVLSSQSNSNVGYDASAQSGQAPYKTEEEMKAELDRTVEEGMLNISISSKIEFDDGSSEGVAYIENVPSNRYDLSVKITLDDDDDSKDDEVLYESAVIEPNSYIEKIKLDKVLPAGEYPATATFTAYDPQTKEKVGQAAAKVTLIIEN